MFASPLPDRREGGGTELCRISLVLRALLEELEALPDAMSPRVLRAEIEIDLAAANDYVARHGSFADLAREHYAATKHLS